MKKLHNAYPKTAYICFFIFKESGKPEDMMPNPEIFNTLEDIKTLVGSFNLEMKKKDVPIVMKSYVSIIRLELIDIFSYTDKKWNNQNYIIKNTDVMISCLKLQDNDYFKYRVLVAPWKDYKGAVLNTIQSVYRSTSNNLNWKKLFHSDRPIVDGTKYIALYKCGPPEIYATDTGVVAELPPKGSEDNPKNVRRV